MYKLFNTPEQKEELIKELLKFTGAQLLGVDSETTGLNAREARLRLLQLTARFPNNPMVETLMIDVWQFDPAFITHLLNRFFIATRKIPRIFANAKFDLQFLKAMGVNVPGDVQDVLMMFKVLHNGLCSQYPSLYEVINYCLGLSLQPKAKKEMQKISWAEELSEEQLDYAAKDTQYLPSVYLILKEELLQEKELFNVYTHLELKVLPVVFNMEYRGVPTDPAVFQKIEEVQRPLKDKLTEEILQEFRENGASEINNLQSPKQVKKAFADIGIVIPNANKYTIADIDHPISQKFTKWKELKTRLQFTTSLPKFYLESTGRIHGSFNQLGTESGRFSASNPNLQQIERPGKNQDVIMRSFVRAEEGYTLVFSDYSQLELRIVAQITKDPEMLAAYRAGKDLHRRTAAFIRKISEDGVTKDDRQMAKAVNFGFDFGMGAPKFVLYAKNSYGQITTLEEAQEMRQGYFELYQGVAEWHKRAGEEIRQGATSVRTLSGRRRQFSRVKGANNQITFSAYLNTQVQGTGGDIIKIAMFLIENEILKQGWDAELILQVHDELGYTVKEDQAQEFKTKVVEPMMIKASDYLLPDVPMEVEANIGLSWDKAK